MPHSVLFVLFIEFILILFTTMLLIQHPKKVFRVKSAGLQSFMHWIGMLFLCLTFCWSVIVGIILSMNDMMLRI